MCVSETKEKFGNNPNDRCPVHGGLLEYRRLPVRFGLWDRDDDFESARIVLFPFSLEWIGGGCEPSDDVNDVAAVCDDCVRDAAVWRNLSK